jgi:hypothetical protein
MTWKAAMLTTISPMLTVTWELVRNGRGVN